MWSKKEIIIEGKKINCMVNESDSIIEIELPYDSKLCKATSIQLNNLSHSIANGMVNIGDRDEVLRLTIIKEQKNGKSNQSRKDTKLSK